MKNKKQEFLKRVFYSYDKVKTSRDLEEKLNGNSSNAVYMKIIEDMLKEQMPHENISNTVSPSR